MNGYVLSLLLAFAAGVFTVAQGTINASVGKLQGPLVMIIGVSFVQLALAFALLRLRGPVSPASFLQPRMLVSGALGVAIMFAVSRATATAGALPAFVTAVAGQIVASAAMDHWGLMGLPRSPMTWPKLASIAVIAAGVYGLLQSSSSK